MGWRLEHGKGIPYIGVDLVLEKCKFRQRVVWLGMKRKRESWSAIERESSSCPK